MPVTGVFLVHECSLEAAWMDSDPETPVHECHQVPDLQLRMVVLFLEHGLHNLLFEFVGTAWSRLAGDQGWQSPFSEGLSGLIPGGSRDTEIGGCPADGVSVFQDPSQHLVPDLDEVAWIEECLCSEACVPYRVWFGIEAVAFAECPGLCIVGLFGHILSTLVADCKDNYDIYTPSCQFLSWHVLMQMTDCLAVYAVYDRLSSGLLADQSCIYGIIIFTFMA